MTGQPLLRLLVGLLLGTLGVSLLPASATAEPKPTLSQVQRQVSTLQHQAEQAIERYNTAKVSLTEATRRLRSARNRLVASQRRLDAKRALIGRIAVASYKAGALDSSVQLLLSDDPTQFLRQAADLVQLNRRQSEMLRGIEADRLRAAVDGKARTSSRR